MARRDTQRGNNLRNAEVADDARAIGQGGDVLVHIQTGMYSEDADINNDGVVDQEDFDLITEELQG